MGLGLRGIAAACCLFFLWSVPGFAHEESFPDPGECQSWIEYYDLLHKSDQVPLTAAELKRFLDLHRVLNHQDPVREEETPAWKESDSEENEDSRPAASQRPAQTGKPFQLYELLGILEQRLAESHSEEFAEEAAALTFHRILANVMLSSGERSKPFQLGNLVHTPDQLLALEMSIHPQGPNPFYLPSNPVVTRMSRVLAMPAGDALKIASFLDLESDDEGQIPEQRLIKRLIKKVATGSMEWSPTFVLRALTLTYKSLVASEVDTQPNFAKIIRILRWFQDPLYGIHTESALKKYLGL